MYCSLLFVTSLAALVHAQSLTERLLSLFYRQTCEDLRQSLFEVDTLSDCSEELGCPLNQHCEPFTCQGLFVHRCVSNFANGAACQRGAQCSSGFCHPRYSRCQVNEAICPEDMLNAGGVCLGLSPFRAGSWWDAHAACPALFGAGAVLVSPMSRAEQLNLQTFLVLRRASYACPYIGVSDTYVEGEFRFALGCARVDGVFSAFSSADLANNTEELSCATLRPVRLQAEQNGWRLSSCNGTRRFVCQTDPTLGDSQPAQGGWV